MSASRRAILMTGAAAVVVLGAGWTLTRAPKKAQAPWRKASEGFGDPRLDVLAYAILAPNPHNMQPWRVRLVDEDSFVVYCDQTRLLPETDPPNRQITIGFGCFLELARQAAAEKGYSLDVAPFPEGEPQPQLDDGPIAYARLITDANTRRDPLFSEILSRRTNRLPYDLDKAVPDEDLDAIVAAAGADIDAGASSDPSLVENLRALAVDAWHIEWTTPATRRESIDVTRIGKSEIDQTPYGLALPGAPVEALNAVGVLTREKMDQEGATAYDQSIAFYEKACETAMAFTWIKTAMNSRIDQLDAGRAWARMQLASNQRGVAFHPLSQALQEFPEMAEPYAHVHEMLGAGEGETVQMLSRLGYAKAPPAAPRELLTSKLISN